VADGDVFWAYAGASASAFVQQGKNVNPQFLCARWQLLKIVPMESRNMMLWDLVSAIIGFTTRWVAISPQSHNRNLCGL